MKVLVISDIHGSINDLNKILEKEAFDKLFILGDLYYHGPRNPLPEGYNSMKTAEKLNSLKDKIICVRGNCDAEVDQMISEFEILERADVEIDGVKYTLTHGRYYNEENIPENCGEVFLYGHTHIKIQKDIDGIKIINPGSISIPKDGSKSYIIIENKKIIEGRIEWHKNFVKDKSIAMYIWEAKKCLIYPTILSLFA